MAPLSLNAAATSARAADADTPCLVLIGGGGHARVAIETARLTGHARLALLDPARPVGSMLDEVAVLGGDDWLTTDTALSCAFHISLATPAARARLRTRVAAAGLRQETLVHPSAIVSTAAHIGTGCFIAAGAILNAGVHLDSGVLVNTGAKLDHDVTVQEDCHIAPGAILTGTTAVGAGSTIGAGAVVLPNLTVGPGAVVGAGAVVIHDVPAGTVVAGNPARPVSSRVTDSA